jgi:hypothetical protein
MFRNFWLLIFSIFFLFSFQRNKGKERVQQQISRIESLIEKGNHRQANILANRLLKETLKSTDKYTILVLKSKALYFSEDLYGFLRASEAAYQLNKDKGDIYKAYYLAEKAAFWHFNMVGDKATKFSDESMRLLRKNWNERFKVPFHFIYQVYGTTFLYRRGLTSGLVYDKTRKVHLAPIMNYFDSSLLILKSYKHFSCEEALIFRSKGTRKLDMINYFVKTKEQQKKFSAYQHQLFKELIGHYNKALQIINPSDLNLKMNVLSLKTLAFYCYGEKEKGDEVFNECYYLYKKNAHYDNENQPFLQVLSLIKYKISDDIINNVSAEKFKQFYSDITSLTADWDEYIKSQKNVAHDSYNISPYISLAILDEYLYQKTKNKFYLIRLTNNVISSYKYLAKSKFNNENIVKEVQKKLKKNEAFLLFMNYNLIKEKKNILITKNRITVSSFNDSEEYGTMDLSINNLSNFKKKAFNKYNHYFKPIEQNIKGINKIYLSIDSRQEFPAMISDTVGNSFDKLNYLAKRFNFVFIYNPIDFFIDQKSTISNKIDFLNINQPKRARLPFMNQMMHSVIHQWKGKIYNDVQNFNSIFNKHGILNVVGHGNMTIYKPTGTAKNLILLNDQGKDFIQSSVKINKCKRELIVVNNCFAGFFEFYTYSNNYLQINLFKNGAKAVIASRHATIDKSSAEIMEEFYLKLKAGFSVEDALYTAKQNYFKSHTGEQAHPIYWAGLQLTSNVKDLRLAPEPAITTDKSWQAFLVLLALVAIVLRFYLHWES